MQTTPPPPEGQDPADDARQHRPAPPAVASSRPRRSADFFVTAAEFARARESLTSAPLDAAVLTNDRPAGRTNYGCWWWLPFDSAEFTAADREVVPVAPIDPPPWFTYNLTHPMVRYRDWLRERAAEELWS